MILRLIYVPHVFRRFAASVVGHHWSFSPSTYRQHVVSEYEATESSMYQLNDAVRPPLMLSTTR